MVDTSNQLPVLDKNWPSWSYHRPRIVLNLIRNIKNQKTQLKTTQLISTSIYIWLMVTSVKLGGYFWFLDLYLCVSFISSYIRYYDVNSNMHICLYSYYIMLYQIIIYTYIRIYYIILYHSISIQTELLYYKMWY